MFHSKKIFSSFVCGALCAVSQTVLAEDSRLDQMISPVSNPVNFEDPRNSTELRAIFLHHEIQDDFITGGGDVQIYALQLRYALSDDFSIIATKDGYVDLNPEGVVPKDEGFANVALGAKYSFYRTDTAIATAGLRYEIPIGDKEVLQGEDEGAINPFVSTGLALGDLNLMAATGMRIRTDTDDSSFWDLDLHADYKIGNFYPLVEMNMVHVMNAGTRLPVADEGADFFNLGASESAGEEILTAGVGARYRITSNIDTGVVYQFPLDKGEGSGIFDWRITADVIVRFDV